MSEQYDDLDELPARPRKDIAPADLELLTLAARALGAVRVEDVDGEEWLNLHFADGTVEHGWNALLFDNDAFDMLVKRQVTVTFRAGRAAAVANDGFVEESDDLHAATRRAIVRAVAEMGERTEAFEKHLDSRKTQQ